MGTTTQAKHVGKPYDYTTPRNKWELQPRPVLQEIRCNYTTPRNKWELQLLSSNTSASFYYTTPRNKWELQPPPLNCPQQFIIPHQEINGNYNLW